MVNPVSANVGGEMIDSPLTPRVDNAIIPDRQRALLLIVRQALIMVLGALEDYLNVDRSIVPKHKRVNA
jgi:hypothetical protein